MFPFLDNFFCLCGVGMIESMLEPHLKQKAGASQAAVGNTFSIFGGVYLLSSPIGGLVRSTSYVLTCFNFRKVEFNSHKIG